MIQKNSPLLSVVVPVYNEASGLEKFHQNLVVAVDSAVGDDYEIIYCDDGSHDQTTDIIRRCHQQNRRVKLVALSRNFGKEYTLTAGISKARGRAILTLDGDGQHPVELIPRFVAAWHEGADVVVGVRTNASGSGMAKTLGASIFYGLLRVLTKRDVVAGTSDYQLIDAAVQQAFLSMPETNRITRGLIDWLGFKRVYIEFAANAREDGVAGYGMMKLMKLALDSFVSLSLKPLYMFGLLGVCISFAAFLLGAAVIVEQLAFGDPWHWKFTGTAMLGILILFLVGVVLMSQGVLSLYVAHIHEQSKGRPLYVIHYGRSLGIQKDA